MDGLSCSWETCDNEGDWFRLGHCSEECQRKGAVLALHRFDCMFEDEEPPTPEEIDQQFGGCSRWTPEAMEQRINEISCEIARMQSPNLEWKMPESSKRALTEDHEQLSEESDVPPFPDAERLMVDFDNTLTVDDVAYWDGERPDPDQDVIDRVNEHYYAGGTVIVWTARPWSEAGRIAAHLTEWGLRWHALRCDKGSGDVYVDDKALRPEEVI